MASCTDIDEDSFTYSNNVFQESAENSSAVDPDIDHHFTVFTVIIGKIMPFSTLEASLQRKLLQT